MSAISLVAMFVVGLLVAGALLALPNVTAGERYYLDLWDDVNGMDLNVQDLWARNIDANSIRSNFYVAHNYVDANFLMDANFNGNVGIDRNLWVGEQGTFGIVTIDSLGMSSSSGITIDVVNDSADSFVVISNSDATYKANIIIENDILATGSVGAGIVTVPPYLLYSRSGASGATANAAGDNLVVESNDHAGISIITPNNKTQYVMFGDPEHDNEGQISYNHDTDEMKFAVAGNTRLHGYSSGNWSLAGSVMVGSANAPLTTLHVQSTSPTTRIQDSDGAGTAATGFVEFHDKDSARIGYFGIGSATTSDFIIQSDGAKLRFIADGDTTDYIQFQTSGNVPEITTVGTANLKLTASSGLVDFDTNNRTATGYLGYNDTTPSYPIDLKAKATDEIIVNIDGTTNDYTGTGAGTGYGLQFQRDLQGGNGNDPKEFVAMRMYLNPKHTSADLSATKSYISIKNDYLDTSTWLNSTAVAKTVNKYGEWVTINDDATFSTASTGYIQNKQIGYYNRMDNDSTFTSTGAVQSYLWTAGVYVLNDITPTLSSGNLNVQNFGVVVDLQGSVTGTSTNKGINIARVSGADNDYGIYDASGARWAIDGDNQKVQIGETNTDLEIYSDGTNARLDATGDIMLNASGGDVNITGNLGVTGNSFADAHIDFTEGLDPAKKQESLQNVLNIRSIKKDGKWEIDHNTLSSFALEEMPIYEYTPYQTCEEVIIPSEVCKDVEKTRDVCREMQVIDVNGGIVIETHCTVEKYIDIECESEINKETQCVTDFNKVATGEYTYGRNLGNSITELQQAIQVLEERIKILEAS